MDDYPEYPRTDIKTLRRLIVLAILAAVVLVAVVFLVFNTIVFVATTGDVGDASVATLAVAKDKTSKVGGSGFVVVPRGTQSLIVTAGDNIKTQTGLDAPWYGFAVKSVQLNRDKNASKVAYAGTDPTCATYDPTGDALLRYDCVKPDKLQRYTAPADNAWANHDVASLSPYISGQILPAYKGGVIGISLKSGSTQLPLPPTVPTLQGGESAQVTVTAADGKQTSYNAPIGFDAYNLQGTRIFTDTSDATNGRFILADAFGTLYLATPNQNDDTFNYKRVEPLGDYSARYNQTFCSIEGEAAYCFRGRTTAKTTSDAKFVTPSVAKLSFTSGTVSTTNVSGVSVIDGFYVTTAGKMYAKNGTSLYTLDTSSGDYSAHLVHASPEMVAAGQDLYFIQGNGVYQLDSSSLDSHQVFYSSNLTVRGVYPVDGKVFVFAAAKATSPAIGAYLLASSNDTTPGRRLIDVLPLAPTAVQNMTSNDFVGSKVFIRMPAGITDYKTVGGDFLKALSDYGIDLPKGNVTLTN